jgi:glycosyltransferase involved in cell wall biosynthesis
MHAWKHYRGNPYPALLTKALNHVGVRARLRNHVLQKLDEPGHSGEQRVLHLHLVARKLLTRSAVLPSLAGGMRFLRSLRGLQARDLRVVWTIHDLHHPETRHRWLDHWLGGRLLRTVDAAIVHSEGAAKAVAQTFHSDARPIHVVPHGHYASWYPNTVSKEEARARLGIPPSRTVFLYFGSIRDYKNLPALLQAFRELDEQNATLAIAGWSRDEQHSARVQAYAAADSRVIARPEFVEDEDVQVYFNASDAVVLPIEAALTSGSVFLAMSFGRAVITPAIFPMTSSLPANGAILYSPRTQGALLGALQAAFTADLAEMGARNYQHVLQNNDWGAVARKTKEIYESLC